MLCFTNFQVMPEFVEFLFPFGFRSYAQDFYFSGFRQRTQLADSVEQKFQLCYNLKSAEPPDSGDWSIRHCAVHFSFDLTKVRTSWIIVKGNELMKRRIESVTSDRGSHEPSDYKSLDGAFKTSLKTHLVFCDWSAEDWRYYINSLEDKFQKMTRSTLSGSVHLPHPSTATTDRLTPKSRTNTQRTDTSKFSRFSRTPALTTENMFTKPALKHRQSAPRTHMNPETLISQTLPPDEDEDEDEGDGPESPLKLKDEKSEDEDRNFSFDKLRKVHEVAEKANEAALVLKQNIIVLTQLKNYYRSVSKRKDFPKDLAESCTEAVDDFELRIDGLENDMQTQILRLETMLRLLEDRKTLVKQFTLSRCPVKAKKKFSSTASSSTKISKRTNTPQGACST